MLDKISALDDETFFKLKAAVKADDERRRYRLFAVGKEATFTGKQGERLRMRITGRGPKNVMGYIIDDEGNHLLRSKWRVNPSLLTPYKAPIVATSAAFRVGASDRPQAQASF